MKILKLLCALLVLMGVVVVKPEIRHIYLTCRHNPASSMTINIQGIHTPRELIIYYDTCSHKELVSYPLKQVVSGDPFEERFLYHKELLNLKSDTTYYFTIGTAQKAFSKEGCFRTASNTGLRFVEAGDWENTKAAEQLARQVAECDPTFVLLGGDYPSDVYGVDDAPKWDHWLDLYTKTVCQKKYIPLVLAIGNHEVLGAMEGTADFFMRYFCQAEKSYFSLQVGRDIAIYILDSGHLFAHEGEQAKWLESELQQVEAPIKFAAYHVPLYPSLRFAKKDIFYYSLARFVKAWKGEGAAEALFCKGAQEGRKAWLPLFDKYGLTCAFEHHDQTLKRTKCLKGGKSDPQGTLYLGDGCFGAERTYWPIQGFFSTHFAMLKGKTPFFWLVDVREGEIEYRAVGLEGKILDRFVQKISHFN